MKHEALTETLIQVFYKVYNTLGYGFLESIYQRAYCIELAQHQLRFAQQFPIEVFYQEISIGEFRADLIVESIVLVEFKAARAFEAAHEKQLLNYLKATKLEVGLLFNFGPQPQFRRLIFDNDRKIAQAATTQP
jgi:GxxExxY protein